MFYTSIITNTSYTERITIPGAIAFEIPISRLYLEDNRVGGATPDHF